MYLNKLNEVCCLLIYLRLGVMHFKKGSASDLKLNKIEYAPRW